MSERSADRPTSSEKYAAAAHFEQIDAGDHVGVVLLHGLGGDLTQPRAYTGGVVDGRAGTRLAADARLHGSTQFDDPEPMTFDLLAADILSLVDSVGLPAARVWIGVSMGAATALRVALTRPAGIRGLVLIRPAWLDQPHPANLEAFGVIADLLTTLGPVAGRIEMASTPVWQRIRNESASMATSLLEQFDKPLAVDRVRRLLEIPADAPFRHPAELRSIDLPMVIVGAPGDPVHPVTVARQWADWLPGARYAQITGRDEDAERHHADLRRTVDGFLSGL